MCISGTCTRCCLCQNATVGEDGPIGAKPLTCYQVIVDLVAGTTTETGLRMLAEWDQGHYPTGIEVQDNGMAALPSPVMTGNPNGTTTT